MLAYEAAMVPEAPSLTIESYLHHTARGTGKLIGNTCQCSAILSGHSRDSQISRACMVFGEEVTRDHAEITPTAARDRWRRRQPSRRPVPEPDLDA